MLTIYEREGSFAVRCAKQIAIVSFILLSFFTLPVTCVFLAGRYAADGFKFVERESAPTWVEIYRERDSGVALEIDRTDILLNAVSFCLWAVVFLCLHCAN